MRIGPMTWSNCTDALLIEAAPRHRYPDGLYNDLDPCSLRGWLGKVYARKVGDRWRVNRGALQVTDKNRAELRAQHVPYVWRWAETDADFFARIWAALLSGRASHTTCAVRLYTAGPDEILGLARTGRCSPNAHATHGRSANCEPSGTRR